MRLAVLALVAFGLLAPAKAHAAPKCKPAGFPCPTWANSGTFNGTFRDEFNDTTVGPAWEKGWFGEGITDPANSDEDNCYDSANVTESSGALHLALTANPVTCPKVGTVPYRGALVNTRNSFRQRFGSVEAHVCFEDGNSDGLLDNWGTFWLNGVDPPAWPDHGEIDVAEVGSDGFPDFHLHYRDSNGVAQSINFTPPQRFGCHNYGIKWTSSTVTLYHDGVQMFSHAFNGPVPEYIIFDHAVDQDRGTPVVTNENVTVDWVRAWS